MKVNSKFYRFPFELESPSLNSFATRLGEKFTYSHHQPARAAYPLLSSHEITTTPELGNRASHLRSYILSHISSSRYRCIPQNSKDCILTSPLTPSPPISGSSQAEFPSLDPRCDFNTRNAAQDRQSGGSEWSLIFDLSYLFKNYSFSNSE